MPQYFTAVNLIPDRVSQMQTGWAETGWYGKSNAYQQK